MPEFNATSTSTLRLVALTVGLSASVLAAEYVVDQRHAKASDDNAGNAAAPYKTIAKAVGLAQAGDTVLIKGGDYRESIEVKNTGTAEQRLTIKGAPGERVLINGADEITGWKKCSKEDTRGNPNTDNIYFTELDWEPRDLYVNGYRQVLSRWPEGTASAHSHVAETGDKSNLTDAAHLNQPAGFWEGGELNVYCVKSTNTDRGLITSYDPTTHELKSTAKLRDAIIGGTDRYYVKNLVSIIAKPGEFAFDTRTKPFRLYMWPSTPGDPAKQTVLGSRRGKGGGAIVTWSPKSNYLTIDGLEVAYGMGVGVGNSGNGSHHIEVQNCVIHHNRSGSRGGLVVYDTTDVVLKRNIVFLNDHSGIVLWTTKRCLITENEVFGNTVDGMSGGWYWDDMRFVRNYVHNQWFGGHPDGFQTYNGCDKVELTDNLFLNVGQGWQCENTSNVKLTNNAWIGTHHSGLSLSDRLTWSGSEVKDKRSGNENFDWKNNTLAFVGLGGTININQKFRIENMIIAPGRPDANMLGSEGTEWVSDYSLLWGHQANAGIYRWKGGKGVNGFAAYQKASGQDAHSLEADPKFRNAPRLYKAGDVSKGGERDGKNQNTKEKLFLSRPSQGKFTVGDIVEVNWDGVRHVVKEVTSDAIVIDPPLAVQPAAHDWSVCNWHDNKAPWPYRYWLDAAKLGQNTTSKLHLRAPITGLIATNDKVEVDWDGVTRTVKEVGADFVVLDPPLATAPTKALILGIIKDTQTPCFTRDSDPAKMTGAPLNRVHLTGPVAGYFTLHDVIEIGQDGVRREINAVGSDFVEFVPALAMAPAPGAKVANWRDNRTFALDIRLAPDSPGWRKGSDGRNIGSNLDVPAIMRGDFDSDGIRDLPEIPTDVCLDF
ncbi:MAG: right-handed parallel beta-helix repeat-containing protein [Planctomycetota bacterium]